MIRRWSWLLFCLMLSGVAQAHPFGNLRIDAVSVLTLKPGVVSDSYQLFLPEASAYGQLKLIDKDGDGVYSEAEKKAYLDVAAPKCLANIKLQVNGRPLVFTVESAHADVSAGIAGLSSLKIVYQFDAPLPIDGLEDGDNHLIFSDDNFTGTPGWKEIQALGDGGYRIVTSPPHPASPIDALETTADIVFNPHGGVALSAQQGPTGPSAGQNAGGMRLASLIGQELTWKTLLVALAVAFGLGALHALTPGHGKTIVGAYLVGSRGTVGQAIFLGGVVTFTHTISVLLLGLVCLVAFQYAVPERLYPWLGFVSGLLIALMGVFLFFNRQRLTEGHEHSHTHEDGVTHSHGGREHSHGVPQKVTLFSLLALGISGGIVPCPDALVVLLSAVALHRIVLGLLVIVAFSLGLAAVLMAIGIVMVTAGKYLEKYYPKGPFISHLTGVTYVFITVLGLSLAVESLMQAGILVLHAPT